MVGGLVCLSAPYYQAHDYRVQIIELHTNSSNEWYVTVQCQIWTRNREPQWSVVCMCHCQTVMRIMLKGSWVN